MERIRRSIFIAAGLLILHSSTAGYSSQHPSAAPEQIVRRYLSAKDRSSALALLAPDYRLWFGKREGEGLSKQQTALMLEWDFELRPQRRVDGLRVNGREVTATIHEENDFALLIGFPGWDAESTFSINEVGLISAQVYVPREGQADWKPYLEKALGWLREHRAEALARLYPNNRLNQTEEGAREWVKVLREWRKAAGLADPMQK